MSARPKIITIDDAKYLGASKLQLRFSDGKEHVVDFGPFLAKSQHLEIGRYLNPRYFKHFTLENGELMWGDFDLVFPIMDLYENRLDRGGRTVSVEAVGRANV